MIHFELAQCPMPKMRPRALGPLDSIYSKTNTAKLLPTRTRKLKLYYQCMDVSSPKDLNLKMVPGPPGQTQETMWLRAVDLKTSSSLGLPTTVAGCCCLGRDPTTFHRPSKCYKVDVMICGDITWELMGKNIVDVIMYVYIYIYIFFWLIYHT